MFSIKIKTIPNEIHSEKLLFTTQWCVCEEQLTGHSTWLGEKALTQLIEPNGKWFSTRHCLLFSFSSMYICNRMIRKYSPNVIWCRQCSNRCHNRRWKWIICLPFLFFVVNSTVCNQFISSSSAPFPLVHWIFFFFLLSSNHHRQFTSTRTHTKFRRRWLWFRFDEVNACANHGTKMRQKKSGICYM